MFNVIYLVPVLLYFSNAVTALSCYECDSSKNVACNIGLLSFTQSVKDCSADAGILSFIPSNCNKIVAKDKEGNEYIARGCGVNTGPLSTCQIIAKAMQFAAADKDLDSINCYTCDTDKCNSASGLSAATFIGILAACFLYLF